MMLPAARLRDIHTCPESSSGRDHEGGPIHAPGAKSVLFNHRAAARIGDVAICKGPQDAVVTGNYTVLIEDSPAARLSDSTAHGGVIVTGSPDIFLGNTSDALDLITDLFTDAAEQGTPLIGRSDDRCPCKNI